MKSEKPKNHDVCRNINEFEAAEVIGCSVKSLRRWRFQNTGPHYLKLGQGKRSLVRYRVSDLEEWLERYLVKTE
jgi:predicted DNA-binding transcriptional regulator AlpA